MREYFKNFSKPIKHKIGALAGVIASSFKHLRDARSNFSYVGRRNWIANMVKSSLVTGKASYITKQFLVANALNEEFKENPEKVIKLLAEEIENPSNQLLTPNDNIRDVLGVLIDLCMYHALKLDKSMAIKYWVSCSYYSYKFLFDKSITPSPLPNYVLGTAAALRYYNISTSEVFSYIQKNKASFYSKPTLPAILNKVKFSLPKSDLRWKIDSFNKFLVSYDYLPNKFKSHSFSPGIGVPVIGINDTNRNPDFTDREVLGKLTYPFTFLINYQTKSNAKTIAASPEFYDNFKEEETVIEGITVPLAKDFTIVLAAIMNTRKRIDGIKFMFCPNKMGKLQGLYFLSPYNPNKIPIVLIHGLFAGPKTWAPMLNTLLNNRTIRQNYQFWVYGYPTGAPIYATANHFRKSLFEAIVQNDPKKQNKKLEQMVLLGHSMGGIIVRLSLQDTEGKKFAKSILKIITDKKIKDMNLTDKEKETLQDYFIFKPLPFVKRAIMISAPHRGSKTALTTYSKMGKAVISLPGNIADKTYSLAHKVIQESKTEEKLEYSTMSTGIGNLSPKNLFLNKSNDLKYKKGVKIHSIIGNIKRKDQKGGTDGVVPYSSSHLDIADTECIVKSDHSAHEKQTTIKEVVRILKEHLEENA